jgi:hypothetical protein
MLILKRLFTWLLETSLEAVLLGVVLLSLFGCDQHVYIKCLAVNFIWIGTMFFSTGYLLSTCVARALWQRRSLWIYPLIATVLFFIHFEILNRAAGGAFDPAKRFVIRVAGGCIVFTCTFLGSLLLRNWMPVRSNSTEARP